MRPPKPPKLRIADGTHIRLRHGDKEYYGDEQQIDQMPKCPAGKSKEFQKWWRHYCSQMIAVGVLTERDLAPIGELCEAHERKSRAMKTLAEAGSEYYETESGIKRHPALITVEIAERTIRSRQNDLGFSPIGRARVPARNKTAAAKVETLGRKQTREA